jgi:hypothetical protein
MKESENLNFNDKSFCVLRLLCSMLLTIYCTLLRNVCICTGQCTKPNLDNSNNLFVCTCSFSLGPMWGEPHSLAGEGAGGLNSDD